MAFNAETYYVERKNVWYVKKYVRSDNTICQETMFFVAVSLLWMYKHNSIQVIKSIYSQADDSVLFTWVKQSDVKAFRELYNRYWSLLVSSAYKRLHSKEKGEDIVQNIFIDLYNRRAAIELTTSLKAYLHQALKYRVFNEHRSELIRNRHQKIHCFNHHCKIYFSIPLERKELETKINTIMHKLPERCQQVFLLSRKENLSNKDISAVLNITVSTVEKHITKALKSIRGHMYM